jgi:hypothetical protein
MESYYNKLNDMKSKAREEMRTSDGEKPKVKYSIDDVSKLEKKPVIKVAVKVGKH